MEPAAVLVAAFQIHDLIFAAVDLALDAGELREMDRVFQHEGVGGPRVEPDVENVVDLFPTLFCALAEKARGGARLVPGVGALFLEGLDDADLDLGVLQDVDRAVRLFLDEHRDRHAPGALARDHPVGARLDHAGDAVLALLRHPARHLDGVQRAGAQRIAALRDVFIHRNEPLRRVAEDDRLLRAPGMRILVLQAARSDQHSGLFERLDAGFVGVALFALVVDDAFAREARRLFGERAVFIDGVGDGRIYALEARLRSPDVKIFTPVSGRRVDETCTGVLSDVDAVQQRNSKSISIIEGRERMTTNNARDNFGRHIVN